MGPKVLYLSRQKQGMAYKNTLRQSAGVLSRGGVVVAPTDTVYGIMARADDIPAVRRIQRIKGRHRGKPMPVLVYSVKDVGRIAFISVYQMKFLKRVWPGPVTVILAARKRLPRYVIARNGSIGIRVPADAWMHDLLRVSGKFLVATSANRSGKAVGTTCSRIQKQLSVSGPQPDLYVDGGRIKRPASDIVDVRGTAPKLIRGSKKRINKYL